VPCCRRRLTRSVCSRAPAVPAVLAVLAVLLLPAGARAQQPANVDEATVGELARLLAASDARTFDEALLRDGLQQAEAGTRRQAALAAGRIGDTAATPLLIAALTDSVDGVRAAAAFSLGLLKDPRGIQPLLDLVQRVTPDQQGFGVFEAVTAIAKIGGAEGARALQLIIDAGRPGTTNQAVSRALLESWRLGALAPVVSLVRFAQDPDALVRWNAVTSLARLGDPRGFQALLTASDDQDLTVRAAAIRGLTAHLARVSRQAPDAVVTRLRGHLTDGDLHVRINTLRALATFQDSSVSADVVPLASDGNPNVAVAAETTLGVSRGAVAVAALRGRLTSANFAIRRQAAIALAEADSAAGVAFADTLARDPDWHWRSVAAEAAGAARDRTRLERLLNDGDGRVVASALEALIAVVPAADTAFTGRAQRLLTNADPAVRSLAADAMARHPDPAQLTPLVDAYRRAAADPIADARMSAVKALDAVAALGPGAAGDVTSRFYDAVGRPADYLVWRMAAATFPGALSGAWATAPPVVTGKTEADYRDAARRYLYPALHGTPDPTVTIDTDRGSIVVELLPGEAPLTVAAFLNLVDRHYFDGQRWHRVVPNFVIQSGDPRDDGWGGPGFTLRDELSPVRYQRGSVGLALSGPDTGGSQYFITVGAEPRLDGTYPIFGRVTSDLSVLDVVSQGDHIRSVHR